MSSWTATQLARSELFARRAFHCNTVRSATSVSKAGHQATDPAFLMPGGTAVLTPDELAALEAHVTTTQAADRVRRKPATIRSWVNRGWLRPINPDDKGAKYFRVVDILRCDRDRCEKMRELLPA